MMCYTCSIHISRFKKARITPHRPRLFYNGIPRAFQARVHVFCGAFNSWLPYINRQVQNLREKIQTKIYDQGSTDFQNCLLHRQELTLREYAAWCEHKSSVARKVAVCYRYLIDKHTKSISETVLSEGIEKLQDCILNEQDESMEHSKKMSHKWKRELPKASQPIEPEEPTEMEPVEKEEMEPEPSLVFPDQDYRKEMPRGRRPKRSWKHRPRPSSGYMPHRRPDWKQTQAEHGGGMWSYPLHDQTYYYPRREKGLGNETAQSANTEAETPPRTTKVPGPITRPLVTTPPTTKLPPTTRK
ncbi:uncharacterized protein LOC142580321 isoform X3 [Dermacentor variabilis]|uniref:uncharacterized protein LOC142580321 isoform X3 n=1 Tax=Dermacentor variabilis TaxID=34621 RepID=UPI003F5B4417